MTASDVYRKGKKILNVAGLDSPAFDAMQIFKFCFNLSRDDLILKRKFPLNDDKIKEFFELIDKRKNGRPLQYILGAWGFMGLDFKVGDGVLVPRDDTEVLVSLSIELVKGIDSPKILDLCSGSGAVAITIAKNIKNSNVTALELSDKAYFYLNENINLHKIKNISSVRADVFRDYDNISIEKFDLIASNPPYIPSRDISSLQKEVQNEPLMALDGGESGLVFYECILSKWKKFLKPGGKICVEIGINQLESVINLFEKNGFCEIRYKKDINGIDRAVCGTLK